MNEKEVLSNLKENTSNKLKGEEAEATIRGRKRKCWLGSGQCTPAYPMSYLKLSKGWCEEINSIIVAQFRWG